MALSKGAKVTLVSITLIIIAIIALFSFFVFYSWPRVMYSTDYDFVMIKDEPSGSGDYHLLIFKFDTGALGYSRVFWAVVPSDYEKLNLADYILPDGYKGKGWSKKDELIISIWEPYYYKDEIVDLKTGDTYKGVKLLVLDEVEK